MATDYSREAGDAEVIVFASTYEEATYADGLDPMFTFLDEDDLPTIGDYTKEFTSDLKYEITITGSDMESETTDSVDIYIGGVLQTTTSVSSTEIKVEVDTVLSGGSTSDFEVFLSAGVPSGWHNGDDGEATMYDAGILLEPKLIHLSANEGSTTGGVLYATIIAAGVNDDYTLVNGSDDICESTRMVAYSLLECVVMPT
jgi:hypothetical protein